MFRLSALVFAFIGLAAHAPAQNDKSQEVKRAVLAVRATTPIRITGALTDPNWKSAPEVTGFFDREKGGLVGDQTSVRILYDNQAIYLGFEMHDSSPDQISGKETVRDSRFQGDENSEDSIEISLDPYRTTNFGEFFLFSVNPLGTPSAKFGPGRGDKTEWQGEWEAKTAKNAKGWTAEMRIPWKALNYPKGKGTFGINFVRYQVRTHIESVWSNIGPQFRNELEGQWEGVIAPSPPRPNLSILPYVLGRVGDGQSGFNTGLDVRYPLSGNLTVVGSLNPDFGTIEGAVEGIGFSRTERFVPERRPFFLEGENFLGYGNDFALGRFFYPRRIQDFDVGAKIYGKLTPKDTIGFLTTDAIRNQTDTILRYRHDVTPSVNVGIFASQRSSQLENNSVVVATEEARFGNFSVYTQLAKTTGTGGPGDGENLGLEWDAPGYFFYLQGTHISPKLRFADGLQGFTDYKGPLIYQSWRGEFRHGLIRSFEVQNSLNWYWNNDGTPFQRGGNISGTWTTRNDWEIGGGYTRQAYYADQDNFFDFHLTRAVSNRFQRIGLAGSAGIISGQRYSSIGPNVSLRVFRHLDVIYSGQVQGLGGVDELHVLTANYEFSPTQSIGGRMVVRNGSTNWYLSWRHAGGKGTDYYALFGDPNVDKFRAILQLKVVFSR